MTNQLIYTIGAILDCITSTLALYSRGESYRGSGGRLLYGDRNTFPGRGRGRCIVKKYTLYGMLNTVDTYWDLDGRPPLVNQVNSQENKVSQKVLFQNL